MEAYRLAALRSCVTLVKRHGIVLASTSQRQVASYLGEYVKQLELEFATAFKAWGARFFDAR